MRRMTSLLILAWASSAFAAEAPIDSTISYQGRLTDGGDPATGQYDMRFSLFDAAAGGNQVGPTLTFDGNGGNPDPIGVADGLFSSGLTFGDGVFVGEALWLRIDVRLHENGQYVTLDPRQPLTAAPYALYALDGPGSGGFWQANGTDIHNSNSGSVGIGTSTPQANLHIDGAGSALVGFQLDSPGSSTGSFQIGSPAGNVGVAGFANNGNRRDIRFTDTGLGFFTRNSPSRPFTGNGLFISERGRVGIGTAVTPLEAQLQVEVPGGGDAIRATTSIGCAVRGISNDSGFGTGLLGFASSGSGFTFGVRGASDSTDGIGVSGTANATSGLTRGVFGQSCSRGGWGVEGFASRVVGNGWGVYGKSNGDSAAIGVFGFAEASTGLTYGVKGQSDSDTGRGVLGLATHRTGINYGVRGVTFSPSGFDFYAAGEGVDYGSNSSRRWKDNIVPIPDPLKKISRLRGVYFDWNAAHGGQHDVGMIAEEVGEVLPEIVQYEENGIDAIGMDYSKMTPLLVQAVNALRAEKDAEIDALRTEKDRDIDALRAEKDQQIDALRARLESLEQAVKRLTKNRTEITK